MKLRLILSTALIFLTQTGEAAIVCGGWGEQNIPIVFKITKTSARDSRGFISVNLQKMNPVRLRDNLSGNAIHATPFLECEKGILSGITNDQRVRDMMNDLLITCVGSENGLQIILYKKDARSYSGTFLGSARNLAVGHKITDEIIFSCNVN